MWKREDSFLLFLLNGYRRERDVKPDGLPVSSRWMYQAYKSNQEITFVTVTDVTNECHQLHVYNTRSTAVATRNLVVVLSSIRVVFTSFPHLLRTSWKRSLCTLSCHFGARSSLPNVIVLRLCTYVCCAGCDGEKIYDPLELCHIHRARVQSIVYTQSALR